MPQVPFPERMRILYKGTKQKYFRRQRNGHNENY